MNELGNINRLDNTMKTVSPQWDTFNDDTKKQIATDLQKAFIQPVPIEPHGMPIGGAGDPRYDTEPDSYVQAFQGVLISQNVTARALWNSMQGLGIYSVSEDEVSNTILTKEGKAVPFTVDAWFSGNSDMLRQTPEGRSVLGAYGRGEFDSVETAAELFTRVGVVEKEHQLRKQAGMLSGVSGLAVGFAGALIDPASIVAGTSIVKGAYGLTAGAEAAAGSRTLLGAVGRNVAEGVAITNVNQMGLSMLGENITAEQYADNLAIGIAFDSATAAIWRGLARSGRVTAKDAGAIAEFNAKVEQSIRNDLNNPVNYVLNDPEFSKVGMPKEFEPYFADNFEVQRAYRDPNGNYSPINEADVETVQAFGWETGYFVQPKGSKKFRFYGDEAFDQFKYSEQQATFVDKLGEFYSARPATDQMGDIPTGLSENDLMPIGGTEMKGITEKAAVGGTRAFPFLSDLSLEYDKNPVVQHIVTRLLRRRKDVNGTWNGKIAGMTPFEERQRRWVETNKKFSEELDKSINGIMRDNGVAGVRTRMGFGEAAISARDLEIKRLLREVAELERIRTIINTPSPISVLDEAGNKVKPPTPEPTATTTARGLSLFGLELPPNFKEGFEARYQTRLERLRELGIKLDDKGVLGRNPLLKNAFLDPQAAWQQNVGDAMNARYKMLNVYSRIIVNADHIDSKSVIAAIADLTGRKGKDVDVILKEALTTTDRELKISPEMLLPGRLESYETRKALERIWNEMYGGFVPISKVITISEILPNYRTDFDHVLNGWTDLLEKLEGHTVMNRTMRELASVYTDFGRDQNYEKLIKTLDQGYDRFNNPQKWENNLPPYSEIKSELRQMNEWVKDLARWKTPMVKDNKFGDARTKRITEMMDYMFGFAGDRQTALAAKMWGATSNLIRGTTLVKSGISQAADTVPMHVLTAMNGVQGAQKRMFEAMKVDVDKLTSIPERNAMLENLQVILIADTSYGAQRFNNAVHEVDITTLASEISPLDRVQAYTERYASATQILSGTTFMNNRNSAGAVFGTAHELLAKDFGIIAKLDEAFRVQGDFPDLRSRLKRVGVKGNEIELAGYVLRVLNKKDITLLAEKIRNNDFVPVDLFTKFSVNDKKLTVELFPNPTDAVDAEIVSKAAEAINYVYKTKLSMPGYLESRIGAASFSNRLLSQFSAQAISVGSRTLVGSSSRSAMARLQVATSMLGAATAVGFAKAMITSDEAVDKQITMMTEHPARFVADRLAWAGAFGYVGEKAWNLVDNMTSPFPSARRDPLSGSFNIPAVSVAQYFVSSAQAAQGFVFEGKDPTPAQQNSMRRLFAVFDTTAWRSVSRVFEVIGSNDQEGRLQYLKDAINLKENK